MFEEPVNPVWGVESGAGWEERLVSCLVIRLWRVQLGFTRFQEESSLETPIYFAIKAGNFAAVRCILAHGGCKLLQHQNRNNMTPFIVAAAEYAEENVGDALRILELLYLHGVSLEEQDDMGQTALLWAARRGSLPIIQWLLSKGANLNHRDHVGGTVLHAASAYALLYWGLSMLNFLMVLVISGLLLHSTDAENTGWMINLLHSVLAMGLWTATQLLWLATFKADPGIVAGSLHRIRDQFASVHPQFTREILGALRWPLGPSYGAYHSQLEQIERQMLLTNLDLCELNTAVSRRAFQAGGGASDVAVTDEEDLRFQAAAARLSSLRDELCEVQEGIAVERQKRLNGVNVTRFWYNSPLLDEAFDPKLSSRSYYYQQGNASAERLLGAPHSSHGPPISV
ncbi:uncharacterized protein LOC34618150 [Cyclospora cayetanensis]|uniref:Uncharacterized protein LOC34618150 n=1 Tax=Cyclospora cayetanensis TaxID=88456 RepID=A0A6P6RX42_9EIME|nr:uncharacterized protein LOC34618150 [Cyclospora cayetanensis]